MWNSVKYERYFIGKHYLVYAWYFSSLYLSEILIFSVFFRPWCFMDMQSNNAKIVEIKYGPFAEPQIWLNNWACENKMIDGEIERARVKHQFGIWSQLHFRSTRSIWTTFVHFECIAFNDKMYVSLLHVRFLHQLFYSHELSYVMSMHVNLYQKKTQ